jgi:quercetin dioxygenase-like cupin family protein
MNTSEREVLILEPGQGEPVWFLDNFLTVKVRSKDGAAFGLLEAVIPAGSETPFHRHHDEDEAFYVLEGRLTMFLEGDRTVVASPGSYVHVPKGVAHGFRVDAPIRMLVLSDPAGFVEFVREAGMAAPRRELPPAGPPDLPRLEAASRKYRIDLLGPLPSQPL